jgi:hypothetical protein
MTNGTERYRVEIDRASPLLSPPRARIICNENGLCRLWRRRKNLEIHDLYRLPARAQGFYVGRRRMIAVIAAGRAVPNVASVFCLDRPNYFFELIIADQSGLDRRLAHLS